MLKMGAGAFRAMSIQTLAREGGAGKQDGAEGSLAQEESWPADPSGDRQVPGEHPSEPRRISVLPLWWRMTHSSRWVARVLASELSLVAFILLLAMVFSKKWLCLSGSRVYQRWPTNVSARIYTSARLMSMGLLYICKSKSCSSSENGKGETLRAPVAAPGEPARLGGAVCALSPPPLLLVVPSAVSLQDGLTGRDRRESVFILPSVPARGFCLTQGKVPLLWRSSQPSLRL